MAFQNYTVKNVILPLQKKLQNQVGYTYPSKASFYREIEILKFPYLAKRKSNRMVYAAKQYDSIFNYFIEQGLIKLVDNPQRKGAYLVEVTHPLNCPATQKTTLSFTVNDTENPKNLSPVVSLQEETQVVITITPTTQLTLSQIGPYAFELVKEAGNQLTIRELQILNQNGFVFHSCQTDIEFETENGVKYVDIYYFSQITFTESFFAFFDQE
jgi:hypothetical protein